jgi:hypothetical protein
MEVRTKEELKLSMSILCKTYTSSSVWIHS